MLAEMSAHGFAYNPKYTPRSPHVPRSVRKRWARKGANTRLRNMVKDCRMRLAQIEHEVSKPELPSAPMGGFMGPMQRKQISGLVRNPRRRRRNPELLVVNNPGRRKMRKKRRRSSNGTVKKKFGGRYLTWKQAVKKFGGVRKAAKRWRKGAKYHPGVKSRRMRRFSAKRRKRASNRRRSANGSLKVKYRKRYYTRAGIAKKLGKKRGSKYFSSHAKYHQTKKGARYTRIGYNKKKRRSRRRVRRRNFRAKRRN